MSPGVLTGLGVLVTRPQAQAEPLARLLEAAGARIYRLPTLETRARADLAATRAAVGPLDRYHCVIFLSTNAVRFGAAFVPLRPGQALLAVGAATGAALRLGAGAAALVPAGAASSEQLLALPELAGVAGKRVLIVRGVGGRELLGVTLRERGAEVVYAEVYTRERATPPPGVVAAVENDWSARRIDVVTATSVEILRALIELLSAHGRELLAGTTLLVGGERIGAAARTMGLHGTCIVAASPESKALFDALQAWRRHTKRS